MDVHEESLALAEAWLERCIRRSPLTKKKSLAPETIDSYRKQVIGSDTRRVQQPAKPLLEWYAEEAPGEPIWAVTPEQLMVWLNLPVRDGKGGWRPPSDSKVNTRSSAIESFFTYLIVTKKLDMDEDVLGNGVAYEDRATARTRDVKLHPLHQGVFRAIWTWEGMPVMNRIIIGLAGLATMRLSEIANLRPEGVDLERRSLTFLAKGGEFRTVHYGDLVTSDYPWLPHLEDFPEKWMKLLEVHAEQALEDWEATKHLAGTEVDVHGDVRKGELSPVMRWFTPITRGERFTARDRPNDILWRPSKADRRAMDRAWNQTLRGAGFANREYTFHQLRHFAATNLWRSGASWPRIKSEMGHDKERTTQGYVDFDPAFDAERLRNEKRRAEQ